jgi:TonB-linked SusC/RagA family outer membrane protein
MRAAKLWRPRPVPGRLSLRAIAALVAIVSGAGGLAAQTPTGTVSGRVVADNSQPLAGAQVSLRGTGLGTRTRDDGRYAIVNVPVGRYRLRAQMLGHRPVEDSITVVAGETVVRDITMRVEALGLDALVITGTAGAARQREVGNAVAQINVSTLQAPPANVGQLLQGRAAGVTVMPSSGMAGSGSMIRLRGNVSVAMSNQPLIYVDGVRIRSDGYQRNVPPTGSVLRSGNDIASPLNDINPADIDRVEVIKGAAAATLYGTEAAAGVIQIFTKRGHSGRPVWTAEVDQGFSRALKFGPDPSRAPPGDTIYSCAAIVNRNCVGTMQAYRDSFPSRFEGLPTRGVSRAGGTSSYLFLDPWLRNGYRQRYALSVGGGGEALQYFVSGTLSDEDGILPNDNEARKVIRGNFSFTPMTNLLFHVTTSYTKNNISNTAAGNNAHGLTLNAFRRDRNYKSNDRPEIVDSLLNQELTSEIDHLVTGGTLTWTPIANLSNKFTVGFDLAQIENRNLRPYGFVSAPLGIISNRRNAYQTLTFDYAGNYSFGIRRDLRSTLSWGGQSVTTEERETSAYGENFAGPGEPTVTAAGTRLGFEERERVVNAGLFGQVLLDLRNRYFLTLGARVDGNSAFGEDFGLQTYPKASFSWVASDERFWPSWSPSMKLRAAWGQSGRAPGAFDAVRNWDPVGWGGAPAVLPRNVGSKDLGPERTTEIELGFDAALFGNRLTSEFTWYRRDIDDALFNVRQIPSLGFLNSQLLNVGEMRSHGVELAANATVLRRGSVEWSVGGSVYTNHTKVISLGRVCDAAGCRDVTDFVLTGDVEGDFGWIMVGQPVPVVRTNECVTNPDAKAAPIISTNAADCVHGPNLPTHTYGVQTNLNLPYGIVFNARGEYMGGHYMYDGAAYNAVVRSVRWPGCYDFYTLQETGRAAEATALDRARCTVSSTRADYFIYPADFFKLREVSLSVAVPQRFVRGASSARLTLAGYNVWKWVNKDFPVFDPETGNNGGFDSRVRSILEHVPPPAVYTASMRMTF